MAFGFISLNNLSCLLIDIAVSALKELVLAIRHNMQAAIALWLFGLFIISSYYYWPAGREFLQVIATWKLQYGFMFSAISTAIFGGLLPLIFSMFLTRENHYFLSRDTGLLTLFWAIKGLEIDLWYSLQARVFGDEANFSTIAIKTLFDQLFYMPILGAVNMALFYHWRSHNYAWQSFKHTLGKYWYRDRIFPLLVSNWGIWIPAVAMIYSLPTALQLPMQNLVLCFWAIILMVLTRNKSTP